MRSPYTLDDPPPLQPPGPVIEITAWSIAADRWHEHHPDTLLGADCMRCRCAWPCPTWEVADGIIAGVYAEHLHAARAAAPARAAAGRTLALPAAPARSAPTGPPPRMTRSAGRLPAGPPPLRPGVPIDVSAPTVMSVGAVDDPTVVSPTLAAPIPSTHAVTDTTMVSPVLTGPDASAGNPVRAAGGDAAPEYELARYGSGTEVAGGGPVPDRDAGVLLSGSGDPGSVAAGSVGSGSAGPVEQLDRAPVTGPDRTSKRIIVARRIRDALFHPAEASSAPLAQPAALARPTDRATSVRDPDPAGPVRLADPAAPVRLADPAGPGRQAGGTLDPAARIQLALPAGTTLALPGDPSRACG